MLVANLLVGALLAMGGQASAEGREPLASAATTGVAAFAGVRVSVDQASIAGDVHSNGDVSLTRASVIDGNVTLVGTLTNHNSTITGSTTVVAPEPLPPIPTEEEARASADRIFEGDTVFDGDVIDDVVFVAGNAQIMNTVSGTGMVIASGDIDAEPLDVYPPVPGQPQSLLTLVAFNTVTIARDLQVITDKLLFRGQALAGTDVILEGASLSVHGSVVAYGNVIVQAGGSLTFETFDGTPPAITNLMPADGAFSSSAQPQISADLADDESGVDPASAVLSVDGVDETAMATVSASQIVLSPGDTLAEGAHSVSLSVSDFAGNQASASWAFVVDTVPPAVAVTSPSDSVVYNSVPPVTVEFSDDTSGVQPGALMLSVDGTELSESCLLGDTSAICPAPTGLAAGQHTIEAQIGDSAGNQSSASLSFELVIDLQSPTVALVAPAEPRIVNQVRPDIQATFLDDGSGIEPTSIHFLLDGLDRTSEATITSGDLEFTPTVDLGPGTHLVELSLLDLAGNSAAESWPFTLDAEPPTVAIEDPTEGQIFNGDTVDVTGTARDGNGVAALEVNGTAAALAGDRFAASVQLSDGENPIVARATDVAGNVAEATVTVVRFSLPEVAITTPPTLAYLATTAVDVTGTVSPADAAVSINGVSAEVVDGAFTAHDVPLVEGGNILTATATDSQGHESTDSVSVVRDLTPPHVQAYVPADGATIFEDHVAVSGLVNDIVPGTVNAGQVTVTVNGLPAEVSNRSFLATGVPLVAGDNQILVRATDVGGNVGETQVTVHRSPANVPRIAIVSGDRQTRDHRNAPARGADHRGSRRERRPDRRPAGPLPPGEEQRQPRRRPAPGGRGHRNRRPSLDPLDAGDPGGCGSPDGRGRSGGFRRPGSVHRHRSSERPGHDRRRLGGRADRTRGEDLAPTVHRCRDRRRLQPSPGRPGALFGRQGCGSPRRRPERRSGHHRQRWAGDRPADPGAGRGGVEQRGRGPDRRSPGEPPRELDGLGPDGGRPGPDRDPRGGSGQHQPPCARGDGPDPRHLDPHPDRRARLLPHPAGARRHALPDRGRQHRDPVRLLARPGVRGHDDPGPGEDPSHADLPAPHRPAARHLRIRDPRVARSPFRASPASPSTFNPDR